MIDRFNTNTRYVLERVHNRY
ncbi:protein of unknown function (plasmid) [Azospirillum baldaniorum]|uniref:Uncharacterized protein n=1 Tax=Azospirillum baldaniorum TaxID=1064539 RepID=A0A9P1K0Y8_9PROT|nr:protein of unknown function [Azospirillum baldaniorum]